MKLPAFLDNALMREVVAIRIDSVFRLLHLLSEDQLPPADAEGAPRPASTRSRSATATAPAT